MEYLFEKKFRLILLWQYYVCFYSFSQHFCFTYKVVTYDDMSKYQDPESIFSASVNYSFTKI